MLAMFWSSHSALARGLEPLENGNGVNAVRFLKRTVPRRKRRGYAKTKNIDQSDSNRFNFQTPNRKNNSGQAVSLDQKESIGNINW